MTLLLIFVMTLLLAAANGANDNIKGAATLVGSGVIGHRGAIALATLTTALGGAASIFLANGLLQAFSGRGIVPQEITVSHSFLLSVAAGAAATVWLATWRGLPISTTHGLLGGLLGAGLAAAPARVEMAAAAKIMLLPLLLSPLIALALSMMLVPMLRRLDRRMAIATPCVCTETALVADGSTAIGHSARSVGLAVGLATDAHCQPALGRSVKNFATTLWIDRAHFLSAGTVSFARGLNDTPKIAALMVAAGASGVSGASLAVIVAMALGGWFAARKVSDTLSFKVTRMDPREGLGGNLVTALLVIGASRFGLPVSTTHVSTGALFGIAAGNGSGKYRMIRNILLAWLFTLPIAALIAYATQRLIAE